MLVELRQIASGRRAHGDLIDTTSQFVAGFLEHHRRSRPKRGFRSDVQDLADMSKCTF